MAKVSLVFPCLLVVAAAMVQQAQPSEPAELQPAAGVTLSFYAIDEPNRAVDMRVSRLIALAVPQASTASAFLQPGPFHAAFEGFINLRIRGDYTFTAHGAGECQVIINGQVALAAAGDDLSQHAGQKLRLTKGANQITVRYTAPANRPAQLRLYWAERDLPPEPIPPTVLTHDASDAALTEHLELRAGRELFAQLRCARCHAIETSMPEAPTDAPSLGDIGSRLRVQWLARWIDHPIALRADASMPRVFHSLDGAVDSRAIDVAAYLAGLKQSQPRDLDFKSSDARHGARLYTGLGCVACHSFEEDSEKTDRVSLARVREKWFASSLAEYLGDPFAHYAWNPMPDFGLSETEARQLAAYLWSRSKPPAAPDIDLSQADPLRGRQLLVSTGCLNCHALPDAASTLPAIPISTPEAGCLSANHASTDRAPHFAMADEQRSALRRIIASDRASLARDTAADFADRQMRTLNCVACHAIDAQPDTWSSFKSEIDKIDRASGATFDDLAGDQSRPSLTWAGERLRADWMARFIGGQVESRPRPWLESRMPSFGQRARLLAEGMAHQHGIFPETEPDLTVNPELAEIGRRLVGKDKGFSCVTCHAVGAAPAISPFEAFGPNFTQTTERMRHDFYTRWVRNPQRYEPGTRMPQYADLEGKTSFRDIFEGDAEKQFEAIWHYLLQGENMQPPK